MTQARRDRRDGARGAKTLRAVDVLVNNAGIQHVSPIEEFPAREVGADHRDQPVLGLPRDARRDPRHEGEGLGPDHQHRLGPFAGRLAVQVGLRRRQARHRRADQDGGAGTRAARDHGQLHLAGLCLDAAGRGADPRHDEGARPDQGAGDRRRAAGGAADQGVRHRRSGRRARGVPVLATRRARSPAPTIAWTAAGRRSSARASDPAVEAARTSETAPPAHGRGRPGQRRPWISRARP